MKKPLSLFVIFIFINAHVFAKTGLPIQVNNNTSSIGNIGKRNYRTGFNGYDEVKLKSIYIQDNYYTASRVMEKSMRSILLAENDTLDQKNPSLLTKVGKESLYIGKQFLFGEICGIGFSLLSAVIFGGLSQDNGLGSFAAGLPFVYLGYAFGNTLGVYWAGNNKQYQGSFIQTLAGSIMGVVISFRIYSASQESHTSALAIAFGPIIGSIIHFNLFRKARVSNDEAFINYYQRTMKWSLGNIYVSYLDSKPIISTCLLQYNFK